MLYMEKGDFIRTEEFCSNYHVEYSFISALESSGLIEITTIEQTGYISQSHLQELEKEKSDILIGCFDEDKLEGCCLLTETGQGEVRLRQMAVISGLQGKGLGRALMQFAENIARDRGYKKITMHARKTAIGFYEKLGYKTTGNEFVEVTVPHFTMEKNLYV